MLDANITISPGQHEGTSRGKQTTRLALIGSYRPPLGRLGAALDQVVLHRVATATIRALLQDVAATLAGPAPAGHPAKEREPWLERGPGARHAWRILMSTAPLAGHGRVGQRAAISAGPEASPADQSTCREAPPIVVTRPANAPHGPGPPILAVVPRPPGYLHQVIMLLR